MKNHSITAAVNFPAESRSILRPTNIDMAGKITGGLADIMF